jgi:maleate cis-trans isomerase
MNVVTEADAETLPRNRIGLIIPSVNTFSEPQFNRFAPRDLGIHVARARVAGPWKRPLPEMAGEIERVMLLTPYHSNKSIIDYLNASGVTVVCDVALKLEALDFGKVTPAEWAELARQNDTPEVEGIFLSCTNTTQIDAIADIERRLGKPVVNSNQAVLWGCLRRLGTTSRPAMPELGRLMTHLE